MTRAPPSQRLEAVPVDADPTVGVGFDQASDFWAGAQARGSPRRLPCKRWRCRGTSCGRLPTRRTSMVFPTGRQGQRGRAQSVQVSSKVAARDGRAQGADPEARWWYVDRVGATLLCKIDSYPSFFDAEQGRSRIVLNILRPTVIEPPKTAALSVRGRGARGLSYPPGSCASRGAAVPPRLRRDRLQE